MKTSDRTASNPADGSSPSEGEATSHRPTPVRAAKPPTRAWLRLFARLPGWARKVCWPRGAAALSPRAGRSRAQLLSAALRRPKHVDGPWQPDGGLRALVRAFSHPDARVRLDALEVVSSFSGEHATSLVTGAIHDVDPEVRRAAVRAAARLGVREVIPALIVATEDTDPIVRELSAEAIGALAGRFFDPADLPALNDSAALKSWWRRARLEELLHADD